MSNYLPATLGIAAMLMASSALANDVSVPSGGKVAEELQIPSLALPTNHFAQMPTGPFVSFKIYVAEILPPIPSEALKLLKLEMLIPEVDSFNSRTAQWGPNPMEAAMKVDISTVGGPASEGDAIDFVALNREGLSRLPLVDSEMFSLETVGLPVPSPHPRVFKTKS
jgi:hypothetical protein